MTEFTVDIFDNNASARVFISVPGADRTQEVIIRRCGARYEHWNALLRHLRGEPETERIPWHEAVQNWRTATHESGDTFLVDIACNEHPFGLVVQGSNGMYQSVAEDGTVEVLR